MTKRNITVAGIVLILLIAIGITIALGGEANAAPVSVGSLGSRTLDLEKLNYQRTGLALSPLGESAVGLRHGLGSGLNHGLNRELYLLTASARGLGLRLESADYSLAVTAPAVAVDDLGENLKELLFTA